MPQKWSQLSETQKAGRRANTRRAWMKYRYGIVPEEYDAILQSQGGVCAICKRVNSLGRLHIDHCHTTGRVRGLLCHNCNKAIGHLKESIDNALSLIAYLRQSKEN